MSRLADGKEIERETYGTWCRTALGSDLGCHMGCGGCAFGPRLDDWSLAQCQKSPTHESHTWLTHRGYTPKIQTSHLYFWNAHSHAIKTEQVFNTMWALPKMVNNMWIPEHYTLWLSNMSFQNWMAAITTSTLLVSGFPRDLGTCLQGFSPIQHYWRWTQMLGNFFCFYLKKIICALLLFLTYLTRFLFRHMYVPFTTYCISVMNSGSI